jgi:hypothetical protein
MADATSAYSAFDQALACFRAASDRRGEALCSWAFGLILARWGQHTCALARLRTTLAYEQEIGHTRAAEHAALLARLEAGATLPAELALTLGGHTVESGQARTPAKQQRCIVAAGNAQRRSLHCRDRLFK